MSRRVTAVVAAGENDAIGLDGDLPWHLPDDLRFFMRYTLHKPMIMGRKTFESIGSKPLPKRVNVVVSGSLEAPADGSWLVARDLESALALFPEAEEVIIAGGAGIYAAALPLLTDVRMTRVHASPEAQVFFPIRLEGDWTLVERETHAADERHAYAFDFEHWKRSGEW